MSNNYFSEVLNSENLDEMEPELVENPEQRCPVILILDTSGSMYGKPIEALNEGLRAYVQDLKKDDLASVSIETSIITFGPAKIHTDFGIAHDLIIPALEADGTTPMAEALDLALEHLRNRKKSYRHHGIPYYRPWVLLITDGEPNCKEKASAAGKRIREAEDNRELSFYTIGVDSADMAFLNTLAPPKRPPLKLKELRFKDLFLWLSASTTSVSNSRGALDKIVMPPIGWGEMDLDAA